MILERVALNWNTPVEPQHYTHQCVSKRYIRVELLANVDRYKICEQVHIFEREERPMYH